MCLSARRAGEEEESSMGEATGPHAEVPLRSAASVTHLWTDNKSDVVIFTQTVLTALTAHLRLYDLRTHHAVPGLLPSLILDAD